jgi:hypothetical protein
MYRSSCRTTPTPGLVARGRHKRSRRLDESRHRVLALRVAQPRARAIGQTDVPLTPVAALVLVDDASNDDEAGVLVPPFGAELNPRHRGRHVAHGADLLEIEIVSHEHRAARRAARLHGRRPSKYDFSAAVRTIRRSFAHGSRAGIAPYVRSTRRASTSAAPTCRCSRASASHSPRGRQQNTLRQSEPCSGNV